MVEIISFLKVLEHERLTERLSALRRQVGRASTDGTGPAASPTLAAATAALLADVYRLISREPGARTLPHLDPRQAVTHPQLATMLRDADLKLDLFKYAHLDHDDDCGDEWLTIEGLQYFRETRKVMPAS